MWIRLLTGLAVFGIGFFVGRELGKMDPVVEELRRRLRDAEREGRVIEGARYKVNKPEDAAPAREAAADGAGHARSGD